MCTIILFNKYLSANYISGLCLASLMVCKTRHVPAFEKMKASLGAESCGSMVGSQTKDKKESGYTTTHLHLFKNYELCPKRDKPSKSFKEFFTYILSFKSLQPCKVGIMSTHLHEEMGSQRLINLSKSYKEKMRIRIESK